MTLERINPDSIIEPFNGAYSHAVVIPPGSRVAHISGQVGLQKDGTVSDDLRAQVEQGTLSPHMTNKFQDIKRHKWHSTGNIKKSIHKAHRANAYTCLLGGIGPKLCLWAPCAPRR